MNKILMAAIAGSAIGLASPGFGQDSIPAAGGSAAPERVIVTRQVTVSHRIVEPTRAIPPVEPALLSGGVGGAIGGYYINGATRADNLPLPGGTARIR